MARPSTLEELFPQPEGRALVDRVAELVAQLGGAEQRVTASQVAFARKRAFAWVWRPGQYVASRVPAVLSIGMPRRIDSPRFKQVVQPVPGAWMHHLELHSAADLDREVEGWLAEARSAAG